MHVKRSILCIHSKYLKCGKPKNFIARLSNNNKFTNRSIAVRCFKSDNVNTANNNLSVLSYRIPGLIAAAIVVNDCFDEISPFGIDFNRALAGDIVKGNFVRLAT